MSEREIGQGESVEPTAHAGRGRRAVAVAAMVVAAASMYCWHLRSDLYGDEGHTYAVVTAEDFVAKLSSPEMVHPPLFFVFAKLSYELTGQAWGIRVPSVVFSLAAIVCAAVAAGRILGRRYVLPAAAVAAGSPFMLDFAAEGRPYALLSFLSVAFLLAFVEFLREENRRTTVVLLIVSAAGLFTHLAFTFTLAFGAVYYLATRRKLTRYSGLVLAVMLAAVGVLMSFMIDDMAFSMEATSTARESHLNIPNFLARLPVALTFGYCTFSLPELGAGRNVTGSMIADNGALVAGALLALAGIFAATATALVKLDRKVWMLTLASVIPVAVGLFAGAIGFFFIREKYFAGIMGAYLLLVTLALVNLARRKIGWVPVAAYVIVAAVSIGHYVLAANEYSRRVDFGGANAAIARRFAPGDAVVLYMTLGERGVDPSRMSFITDPPTLHIIRRGGDETVSPVERAKAIRGQTEGTIFLVSREVSRNWVDPAGDVIDILGEGRTVEGTRYGRNLTLYILEPTRQTAAAADQRDE